MDNNAAEILERVMFNEDEKHMDRMLKRWKRKNNERDKKARLAMGLGAAAGVATVGGLVAWQRHVEKKAEEESKKKKEQKG
jgi:hypothetical protein